MSVIEEQFRRENTGLLQPEDIQGLIHVDGVPAIKMPHLSWCGYTSLSMLLQHQGHNITPVDIFEQVHQKEYKYQVEDRERSTGPNLDFLAETAETLAPVTADIWTARKHARAAEKYDRTPYDVLQAYIEKKQLPVMVRLTKHYNVVTGIVPEHTLFTANEPLTGIEAVRNKAFMERSWAGQEDLYPGDTRYLMLALRPKNG